MCFFFFNDTATTEIYTLSLHDALPIFWKTLAKEGVIYGNAALGSKVRCRNRHWFSYPGYAEILNGDRKSTRLNSSHSQISYAVFCLKKKKKIKQIKNDEKQQQLLSNV